MKLGELQGPADSQDATDESQLIDLLRRGQPDALERLIAIHQPRIARLVHRLAGWSSDADDLVQDVFVKALASVSRFRGDSQPATWLTRIAINTCRQHHRTRLLRASFWKRRHAERHPAPSGDASSPPLEAEMVAEVRDCVRRLPARYREVIVLHYLAQAEIDMTELRMRLSLLENELSKYDPANLDLKKLEELASGAGASAGASRLAELRSQLEQRRIEVNRELFGLKVLAVTEGSDAAAVPAAPGAAEAPAAPAR